MKMHEFKTAGPSAWRLFRATISRLARAALCLSLLIGGAHADDSVSLDVQVEDIKARTLELNRDLFILEEQLLFPDNTQVAVFVSLDIGEFFTLDAVKLSVDDQVVSNYLYTARQVDALRRGGVHRLYTGNLTSGKHEVVAVFTGRGPHGRDYRRATSLVVDKTPGAKHLELQIVDAEDRRQPEFRVREW